MFGCLGVGCFCFLFVFLEREELNVVAWRVKLAF